MPEETITPDTDDKRIEQLRPKTQKLSAHFALPLSGTDTLVKIIKGYAIASNGGATPVNYKDVASATGLTPSIVSRNNGFLAESQIITSPKYGFYIPSELAVKFAREAAWDEANSKRHLRAAIRNAWYGIVVVQNFATRPSLSREDLKRVLAIKSGATEGDSESLGRLIDFLAHIGFISEAENGTFTRQVAPDDAQEPRNIVLEAGTGSLNVTGGDVEAVVSKSPKTGSASPQIQINLNINIASISELTDLDAKTLRKWLKNVLRTDNGDDETET